MLQSCQGPTCASLSQSFPLTRRLTRGFGGTRPANLESGAWGHPPPELPGVTGGQRQPRRREALDSGPGWGMDVVLGGVTRGDLVPGGA